MGNEIISSIITASATILAVVLSIVAKVYSRKYFKLKETLSFLLDDWEFLYKVEETLLCEIHNSTGNSTNTKKIESRKIIERELGRKLHIEGLSSMQKIRKNKF